MRDCHELDECRPPEECIVCYFKIGYLESYVLGVEVLLSPEGHGKRNMADGGRCCSGDYSVEGSPTRMQH
jgi:hypothetical protein